MSDVPGISADQLKSFLDRVERLEDEIANIRNDIKEIYAEAKAVGLDTKIMKHILKLKKMDDDERDTQDAMIETYRTAVDI